MPKSFRYAGLLTNPFGGDVGLGPADIDEGIGRVKHTPIELRREKHIFFSNESEVKYLEYIHITQYSPSLSA